MNTIYCIIAVIEQNRLKACLKRQTMIKGLWIAMKEKSVRSKKFQAVQNPNGSTIKEIKPEKKRKKRYILLYLALIGFVFYAVITIVNQNVRIADKRAELKELQQQINVIEIQTQYLKKVQGFKGEELSEYMEKIAKEELGYVSEGERIFINVAGD